MEFSFFLNEIVEKMLKRIDGKCFMALFPIISTIRKIYPNKKEFNFFHTNFAGIV